MQKIKNWKINKFKKNNILFWKIIKNYSIIVKVEFAFLISANLKAEKLWFIDSWQY